MRVNKTRDKISFVHSKGQYPYYLRCCLKLNEPQKSIVMETILRYGKASATVQAAPDFVGRIAIQPGGDSPGLVKHQTAVMTKQDYGTINSIEISLSFRSTKCKLET